LYYVTDMVCIYCIYYDIIIYNYILAGRST